jgi:TonB family protein
MATERFQLPGLNGAKHGNSLIPADTQARRLLIALAILLVVLVAVVEKNSDFWFGPGQVADADSAASENISNPSPAVSTHSQAVAAEPATVKTHHAAKASIASAQPAPAATEQNAADTETQPVVASHRVALPPLEAEVVAGDKHSTVRPGSNVMVAEIPPDPNRPVVASAADYERLSGAASPELRQTIEAPYPMLSQHSRVQGSVVLEAVIGTDGVIEGLRLVSGPAILNNAAQQAVRQWRFKPYLLNGRAVETKCMVTVNFSIRVSDTSSKIS